MQRLSLYVATTVLLLCSACKLAATQQQENDQDAKQIVQRFVEQLGQLKSFKLHLEADTTIKFVDDTQSETRKFEIGVERPNKIYVKDLIPSRRAGQLVSNGQDMYVIAPLIGVYVARKAPPTIDDILQDDASIGVSYGLGMSGVVLQYLEKNAYERVVENSDGLEYLGEEVIGGISCHCVRLLSGDGNTDLWFNADQSALLLRMVPDLSQTYDRIKKEKPEFQGLNVTLDLNWEQVKEPAADRFAFIPGQRGPSSLLGKIAPAVRLKLLNGDDVSIARHKQKEIVILEFWTTWCRPCIRAMPETIEVINAYREKGVVLYPINQREDPDRVRSFMKAHGWDVPMAMDSNGIASRRYAVNTIPRTVLIGKDGKIKTIYTGYSRNIKRRLEKELDTLLAEE